MLSETYKNAQILVVDDVPANVALLESVLEEEGFDQVYGLSDPRLVMDALAHNLPHLILLDIRMPFMDGYEILENVKRQYQDETPPIIVLTAQTDSQTKQKALSLGAINFIHKPFDHEEVVTAIKNALNLHYRALSQQQKADHLQKVVEDHEEKLKQQALLDPATNLPNRRALLAYLEQQNLHSSDVCVCFVRLEVMDDIAQMHGLKVSEDLLIHIAAKLQSAHSVSPDFVGLWSNANAVLVKINNAKTDAAHWGQAIYEIIAGEHTLNDLILFADARVGVSHSNDCNGDSEELIQNAATAVPSLTHSQAFRVFHPAMLAEIQHRNQLTQALKKAIQHTELTLVFQPKIRLSDGKIMGAEALIRWHSASMGQVSPGEFIPLAEQTGDILNIGQWVIDAGLKQLAQWRSEGRLDPDFILALNVSSRQLMQKTFADDLILKIAANKVPFHCIQIEVTESDIMDDIDHAISQLTVIHQNGIEIALDDFGTGYSSLAYLRKLPIDVLKIDRSFVMDITENKEALLLAESVVAMANIYRLKVIAEGVETQEQHNLLKKIGCLKGQGYLYSKPLEANDFQTYLTENHA